MRSDSLTRKVDPSRKEMAAEVTANGASIGQDSVRCVTQQAPTSSRWAGSSLDLPPKRRRSSPCQRQIPRADDDLSCADDERIWACSTQIHRGIGNLLKRWQSSEASAIF